LTLNLSWENGISGNFCGILKNNQIRLKKNQKITSQENFKISQAKIPRNHEEDYEISGFVFNFGIFKQLSKIMRFSLKF